ncbi:MAG: hypothetical protein ACR2RA_25005 [Geminicoccaceae bacterium]
MVTNSLVEIFSDERGRPNAKAREDGDRRASFLAGMLIGGIQRNLADTESSLKQVVAVQTGEIEEASIGGNDYDMTVSGQGAELEIDAFPDDPPQEYTVEEVRDALERWKKALLERK